MNVFACYREFAAETGAFDPIEAMAPPAATSSTHGKADSRDTR